MPRTRKPYPPEFREQILELVRAGRTPNELAREFEPSGETIRNWVKQAEIDAGNRQDGLTSDEKQELNRLRRENKQLRIEREILAKAAALFTLALLRRSPTATAHRSGSPRQNVVRWPKPAVPPG